MYLSAPGLASGVIEDQLVVLREALCQIAHSLIWRGGEGLVHVEVKTLVGLELQILSNESNNPTNSLLSINLKVE